MGINSQPDEVGAVTVPSPNGRKINAFSDVDRKLTKREQSSSGVVKMLFESIDRLEEELRESRNFREKFHESDKQVGILREQLKVRVVYEVLSMSTAAAGAALLSYATSIWSQQPTAGILVAVGTVISLGSIVAKIAKVKT